MDRASEHGSLDGQGPAAPKLGLPRPLRTAVLALTCGLLLIILAVDSSRAGGQQPDQAAPTRTTTPSSSNPDAACRKCHESIFDRYEKTPKAHSSGPALDAFQPGTFSHQASGVRYDVRREDGKALLTYERAAGKGRPALAGTEELTYFVGSGKRGRTYLFSRPIEGGLLWYEAPINWYTRSAGYGMAPAYERAVSAPLALPAPPECLHCHVTNLNPSLPQASNAFAGAPFRQGGVGCASCHGDPAEHLRTNGHGGMLNLHNATAHQRESLCLSCHLEGDALVARAGQSIIRFVAGQSLETTSVAFANATSERSIDRASSQYEGLLRSACRRATGPQLTCLTCHDPHSTPDPAERVEYFRTRCLQCHNTPTAKFSAATHFPAQRDCASCHMPRKNTSDISHEQTVDHDIEAHRRTPAPPPLTLSSPDDQTRTSNPAPNLIPIGDVTVTDRDRGLAYAQLAERGNAAAAAPALRYLLAAEKAGLADRAVHEQLAYLSQVAGDKRKAYAEDLAVLETDPHNAAALISQAVLLAASGHGQQAQSALEEAIRYHPAEKVALLDLAQLSYVSGEKSKALELLQRAQRLDPDDPSAQTLRKQWTSHLP